ncbi:MAG: hypothetical protein ACK5LV_07640 [Lachnospirales bacterium]
MNDNYWNDFLSTGSLYNYLKYKEVARENDKKVKDIKKNSN